MDRFVGRSEANGQMVGLSPGDDGYPQGRRSRPWEVGEVVEGLGAPPGAVVEGENIRVSPEDWKKPIDITPGVVTRFLCLKRQQMPKVNLERVGAGGR